MRIATSLNSFESKLTRLTDDRKYLVVGFFTVVYLIGTLPIAGRKLLWNDELYTYYMCRLGNFAEIWNALLSGGEQLAPLFYVITRTFTAVFGESELSYRLPEIVGFWVMGLCLFRFVSLRSSSVFGLVAALFPLVTNASYYASEARPYGLVLGFGALALISWQAVTAANGGWRRAVWLLILAVSLCAAISNHYYAVLLCVPVALGEAVRTANRRRVDVGVWCALALAGAPLVAFLPLIQRARSYAAGGFWSPPRWLAMPDFYHNMLAPAALSLTALIFLAAIRLATRAPEDADAERGRSSSRPPTHEIAAAFGFVIIPVIGVVIAKFVTKAFVDRYVISAVIGLSVLVALSAHKLLGERRLWGALLAGCLCVFFVFNSFKYFETVSGEAAVVTQSVDILRSEIRVAGDLPVVISDPHTVVVLSRYAPADVAGRLIYLSDPEISRRRLGFDSVDRGMLDTVKPWFKLNVAEFRPYLAEHRRFLLYGNTGALSWIVDELRSEGWQFELRGKAGNNTLFLASAGASSPGVSGSGKSHQGDPRLAMSPGGPLGGTSIFASHPGEEGRYNFSVLLSQLP